MRMRHVHTNAYRNTDNTLIKLARAVASITALAHDTLCYALLCIQNLYGAHDEVFKTMQDAQLHIYPGDEPLPH